MPLALLELPLFVLLPKLYSDLFGLQLGLIGSVLLITRMFDAISDPIIGVQLDKHAARFNYRFWIIAASPALLAGFIALLWAPAAIHKNQTALVLWLGAFSIVTYLAYSIISIAYQSWGAQWGSNAAERTRVTGVREVFGLLGVLIASAWLTVQSRPELSIALGIMIAIGCFALTTIKLAPVDPVNKTIAKVDQSFNPVTRSWALIAQHQNFRWLLAVFAINGIATAIPATLVLFFVADVIGAPDQVPKFLLAYFLAGALGMPVWTWLAQRIGLRNAWLVGMIFSVLAFAGAITLGRGDSGQYLIVCLITGLALGADLALPPALLAGVIRQEQQADAGSTEATGQASYFGLWNLVTKLNLAVAAGIGLPLLQWFGYEPTSGGSIQSSLVLTLVYAGLPCILKLVAGATLLLAPLKDSMENSNGRN